MKRFLLHDTDGWNPCDYDDKGFAVLSAKPTSAEAWAQPSEPRDTWLGLSPKYAPNVSWNATIYYGYHFSHVAKFLLDRDITEKWQGEERVWDSPRCLPVHFINLAIQSCMESWEVHRGFVSPSASGPVVAKQIGRASTMNIPPTPAAPIQCTCDMMDLLRNGCTCGAIQRYKA